MARSRLVGLFLGIGLAIVSMMLPLPGLGIEGRKTLALTLMTVTFWALQVAHSGFVAGLFLMLLIIFGVSTPAVVLSPLTGSSTFLIIGAYLLAAAVRSSCLGERIAYAIMLRFVSTYRSLIVAIFLLSFVLSLLIPHAWPRSFLMMSVMLVMIRTAGIGKQDAKQIGFAVFASTVPISLIFLTGASVTNPLALHYAQVNLGWFGWLKVMGLPAMIASVLTLGLFLLIFKQNEPINFDTVAIRKLYADLGPLSEKEKRILIWLVIAIFGWFTDSIHGIDIGWITFLVTIFMSFPIIGEVIEGHHWKEVPLNIILYIAAAIAIGTVGSETGMNAFIANWLLPAQVPSNPYMLALVVTTFTLLVHMALGSVLSVMGVTIPALLAFISVLGNVNPLVVVLWAYTVIGAHFILPYHHTNILVGVGAENGLYCQKETMRLGFPLIAVVYFITVLVQTTWWLMIGVFYI